MDARSGPGVTWPRRAERGVLLAATGQAAGRPGMARLPPEPVTRGEDVILTSVGHMVC